jgi:hypothetical protein
MSKDANDADNAVYEAAEGFREAVQAGDLSRADEIMAAVKVQSNWTFSRTRAAEVAAEALAAIAVASSGDAKRLYAIALFGRLDALTNRKTTAFIPYGERAMDREPPRLVIDGKPALDAKARAYIAAVVRDYARASWQVSWSARAMVDEANSPTVREELAKLLLNRAENVASVFQAITGAVPGSLLETPGRKDAELTRSKQAARMLAALQPALRLSPIDTGDNLAAAANAMIKALVIRFKAPKGEGADSVAATGEAVSEALGFIQTLMRTRFSISIEAESYALIRPLQVWAGGSWPAETAEARAELASSVREAIALQARMQTVNRDLLAALILLMGDREAAVRSLTPLTRIPGLQPEVQKWLASGGAIEQPRRSSGSAEGAWREADGLLAQTSARAIRLRSVIDRDGVAIVKAMRAQSSDGALANAASLLVNLGRAVTQTLVLTMAKRNLELFEAPGEKVAFVPTRHETSEGTMADSEFVEVLEPGALRRGPTGAEDIIRKATVRSVRG